MKKFYSEIGFGNKTFLSTEIENDDEEYRVDGFLIPDKIKDFYFRLWIFKKVLIISISEGFKLQTKNKNNFKILFGISGEIL